jgi:hypothetical protein
VLLENDWVNGNKFNDRVRNRTRDFSAGSIVLQ